MPLLVLLQTLEPAVVVNALALANLRQHVLNTGHHALQAAEVNVRAAVQLQQRRAAGDFGSGDRSSPPSSSDASELDICFLPGGAASSRSSEMLSSQLSDSSTVAPLVKHPAYPVEQLLLLFLAQASMRSSFALTRSSDI